MSALAIALVITAAILHAGWNVLLKTSGDPLRTAVRLQAIGSLVLVPLGFGTWLASGATPIDPGAIALAFGSGLLECAYFLFLSAAYARGDLSLVYPIARGSAPLVAILVGLVILQERLATGALLGVACLVVGILLVARPWRAFQAAGEAHRAAIGFALLTGASIAAYSAVDRVGVRLAPAWLYGAMLAVFATVSLAVVVRVGRRAGVLRAVDPAAPTSSLVRDGVIGVMSLTAYLLILFAYSQAPLAAVAPLRESGIVIAAVWGIARLGESADRREATTRLGAAGLVVVGAILLAISR